jgi:acetyl-CoA C-acetyltransferase
MLGAQSIANGDADIVVCGGQENMSAAPHVLNGSRDGFRMGDAKMVDSMIVDGLWDVYNQYHMGVTAENVAKEQAVTREEQDEFAVKSQNKTEAAQKAGRFNDEIVPYEVPDAQGTGGVRRGRISAPRRDHRGDEGPQARVRQERHGDRGQRLGHQRWRGRRDSCFAKKAKELGLKSLGPHQGLRLGRRGPEIHGHGPGARLQALPVEGRLDAEGPGSHGDQRGLRRAGDRRQPADGWDLSKVNVNGGAIALGHPIGASGARILVTLLHEMQKRDAKKGLASLCIGGGMGVALAVER